MVRSASVLLCAGWLGKDPHQQHTPSQGPQPLQSHFYFSRALSFTQQIWVSPHTFTVPLRLNRQAPGGANPAPPRRLLSLNAFPLALGSGCTFLCLHHRDGPLTPITSSGTCPAPNAFPVHHSAPGSQQTLCWVG